MSGETIGGGVERGRREAPAVAVELTPDASAPAGARHAIEPLRNAMPAEEFADVRLLVSELVVDELRGRHDQRGGTIHLAATLEGGTLRLELVEGWSPPADASARPEPGEPGWGIYLAQLLGDRWGAQPAAAGTRIWVEKRVAGAD